MLSHTYKFRPLENEDLPMFYRWVKQPHIAKWWLSDSYEAFAATYQPDIQIKNTVHPFIMYLDQKPIGYAHYYDTDKWMRSRREPTGTIGIDIIIGEIDYLGKGHGTEFVRKFVAKIFKETTAPKIIIDPNVENTIAIRCYEKVGFKGIKEVDALDEFFDYQPGKVLLMELNRPARRVY